MLLYNILQIYLQLRNMNQKFFNSKPEKSSNNIRKKKLTLCSSSINVITFKQTSTPSSSRGKCRGKSTRVNLVWSGRAKHRGGCMLGESISTSTLVLVGTGTGALRSLSIQVSISRTSCKTIDEAPSKVWPLNTDQTFVSLIKKKNLIVI